MSVLRQQRSERCRSHKEADAMAAEEVGEEAVVVVVDAVADAEAGMGAAAR